MLHFQYVTSFTYRKIGKLQTRLQNYSTKEVLQGFEVFCFSVAVYCDDMTLPNLLNYLTLICTSDGPDYFIEELLVNTLSLHGTFLQAQVSVIILPLTLSAILIGLHQTYCPGYIQPIVSAFRCHKARSV